MSRSSSAQDRKARVELLQARAALERQSIVHGVHDVKASLKPRALLESVFPKSKRKSPSDLLLRTFSMSRRYPMVLSLGSAIISKAARRRLKWWKLAAGALVAWQASRNLRR